MNRFLKLSSFLMVVCIILFWGCDKDSSGLDEPETDLEAIEWLIQENPAYFNTESHYGEEDTTRVGGSRSSIIPFYWYRNIDLYPSISVNIEILEDSAYVVWSGEFDGIFNLLAYESSSPDTIYHYTKDYIDFGERHAIFKRLHLPEEDPLNRRGWRLTDISGAESISQVNTVRVNSVRLNSASYPDTLFMDPLALFALEDIITVAPEEVCSLTVYTNSQHMQHVDYIFFHSWSENMPHHRSRFDHIGDGNFTGVWIAPSDMSGALNVVHHSAFDMISYETLEDDTLSYNSNAWLFPYRVVNSR